LYHQKLYYSNGYEPKINKYYSPDHKYIAQIYKGYFDHQHVYFNPFSSLRIIIAKKQLNGNLYNTIVSGKYFKDVYNCVWLPGYHHILVIATSSIYSSQAFIAIWNGEKNHIYYLIRGLKNGTELYKIIGVYSNGLILYHHINYYKTNEHIINCEQKRILRLYIPKLYLKDY